MRIIKKKSTSWKVISLLSKRSSGFTLVEISIVVLILGMLFTMLLGVKLGVDKVLIKSRTPMQRRTEAFQIFQNIITSINNTFYLKNDKNLVFIGKDDDNGNYRKDRLDFISVDPYVNPSNREAEVKELSYYLKEKEDSDTFYLIKREDASADKHPLSGGEHIILLNNVKSFELKYSSSRISERFKENWDSKLKKRIPRRVKLKMIVEISPDKELSLEGMAVPGMALR